MPTTEQQNEHGRLLEAWLAALKVHKQAQAAEIAAFAACAQAQGTGPSDGEIDAVERATKEVEATHDAVWAYWRANFQ